MKVTVTHLKAPWPEGTKPGDVVDVGDTVPAWAVGKCTEVVEADDETKPEGTKPGKAKK